MMINHIKTSEPNETPWPYKIKSSASDYIPIYTVIPIKNLTKKSILRPSDCHTTNDEDTIDSYIYIGRYYD